MNKDYVLFNLKEAEEQLLETIKAIEANPDYGFGEYVVDMSHLYHHINTAWNAQKASNGAVAECSEENFNAWRSFPRMEELSLEP